MPVSDYRQISDVSHIVIQLKPKKLLDIGVGFGKYGVNCREVLDVYNNRVLPAQWLVVIEGVEIFESYRNPIWVAYDHVYIGNAMQVLDTLGSYDVILCCDVIEHFNKEDGFSLLTKMLDHAPVVLITSPIKFYPQDAVMGNKHERHRSIWSKKDFASFPHLFKEIEEKFMVVVACDESYVRQIKLRHPLDIFGVKRGAVELLKLIYQRLRIRLHCSFANKT
jgi:hypothetical protein